MTKRAVPSVAGATAVTAPTGSGGSWPHADRVFPLQPRRIPTLGELDALNLSNVAIQHDEMPFGRKGQPHRPTERPPTSADTPIQRAGLCRGRQIEAASAPDTTLPAVQDHNRTGPIHRDSRRFFDRSQRQHLGCGGTLPRHVGKSGQREDLRPWLLFATKIRPSPPTAIPVGSLSTSPKPTWRTNAPSWENTPTERSPLSRT